MILDSQPSFRAWAQGALGGSGSPIQCFESGRSFLEAVRADVFGCALVDLNPPDMDGLEVLESLARWECDLIPVAICGEADVSTAVEAMKRGAIDVLQKPISSNDLRDAVLDATAKSRRAAWRTAERKDAAVRFAALDERQFAVLRLSLEARSVKEIAAKLNMPLRTVERYRASALRALEVSSIVEAAEIMRKASLGKRS